MNITEQNRALVAGVFAELERGNPLAFRDAMADDIVWRTPGSSVWSREFRGKPAVLNELLGPVRAQLVQRVRLTIERVLADGDHVVIQATGRAATKTGQPYNNVYCMVFRVAGGKFVEITEYLDTQLACERLKAPWDSAAAT